jgi:hypothetical protein
MRLGLLGPAEDDLDGLAHAASFLLSDARVDRAIYLGDDDALEQAVAAWASSFVGGDPSDEGVWTRAVDVAIEGGHEDIDVFVKNERARQRLRALERLPHEGRLSAEMFGDKVAILICDKAKLDEEDIYSATFLIYGKSDAPLTKKIGSRWFVTPGRIGSEGGGCLVMDDADGEVVATFFDKEGIVSSTTRLPIPRGAKMSVQGGS